MIGALNHDEFCVFLEKRSAVMEDPFGDANDLFDVFLDDTAGTRDAEVLLGA